MYIKLPNIEVEIKNSKYLDDVKDFHKVVDKEDKRILASLTCMTTAKPGTSEGGANDKHTTDIEEVSEPESYAYSKLMQLGLDEETVYEMLDEYFDEE